MEKPSQDSNQNQKLPIEILLVIPPELEKLGALLSETYNVNVVNDVFSLESHSKDCKYDLVIASKDLIKGWALNQLINAMHKKILWIKPYKELLSEDKNSLLKEIHTTASDLHKLKNESKLNFSFPEEKEIELSLKDIEKIIQVSKLLGSTSVKFVDPKGNITEIKRNDNKD